MTTLLNKEELPTKSTNLVKYPHITVPLVGNDGNAFAIIGAVSSALKDNRVSKEERDAFINEAMSGDYDNLLVTCMKWVNVE